MNVLKKRALAYKWNVCGRDGWTSSAANWKEIVAPRVLKHLKCPLSSVRRYGLYPALAAPPGSQADWEYTRRHDTVGPQQPPPGVNTECGNPMLLKGFKLGLTVSTLSGLSDRGAVKSLHTVIELAETSQVAVGHILRVHEYPTVYTTCGFHIFTWRTTRIPYSYTFNWAAKGRDGYLPADS